MAKCTLYTTLCDKVCQWPAAGLVFSMALHYNPNPIKTNGTGTYMYIISTFPQHNIASIKSMRTIKTWC